MANITFNWDWEADKPSERYCATCGFRYAVTASATELKDGFIWFCPKCGARCTHGSPKPTEPKQSEPQQTDTGEKDYGLGYPQSKRLFERKILSDWLELMIGKVLNQQRISAIATKFKAYYKREFGRPPAKDRSINSYSGLEFNTIIVRMFEGIDRPLVEEIHTLHLEKMRSEITVGCVVFGTKGLAREITELHDDYFGVVVNGVKKRIRREAVLQFIHPDPSKNF